MPRGIRNEKTEKRLTGRAHRAEKTEAVIMPVISDLTCPKFLRGPARVRWDEMVAELRSRGLLTVGSLPAFVVHCQSVGDLAEAQAHLDREGRMIKGARGAQLVRNPWTILQKSARDDMLRTAKLFGMSPDSASKVKPVVPKEKTINELLEEMAAKDEAHDAAILAARIGASDATDKLGGEDVGAE